MRSVNTKRVGAAADATAAVRAFRVSLTSRESGRRTPPPTPSPGAPNNLPSIPLSGRTKPPPRPFPRYQYFPFLAAFKHERRRNERNELFKLFRIRAEKPHFLGRIPNRKSRDSFFPYAGFHSKRGGGNGNADGVSDKRNESDNREEDYCS